MNFLQDLLSSNGKNNHRKNNKATGDGTESIPQVASTPTELNSNSNSFSDVVVADDDNPYQKYGLGSPPKGKNSQTLEAAEDLVNADGFGKYLKAFHSNGTTEKTKRKSIKAQCLIFLYGRFFLQDKEKKYRQEKVRSVLNQPSALERLVWLLESEGADRDITASNEDLYRSLRQTLRSYFQQEGSFGFVRNQSNHGDYFFRIQRQGNCFMQAACVMVPYLLQSRGIEGCYPVDLSKFVRHAFTDRELYNYIVLDAGGNSIHFLEKMMISLLARRKGEFTSRSANEVNNRCFDLEELLANYGPGLVTGFDCNKHFKNKDIENNRNKIGYIRFRGRHHSHGEFVDLKPTGADDPASQSIEMTLETHRDNLPDRAVPQELFPSNYNSNMGASHQAPAHSDDGGRTKEESHAMVLIGGRRENGNLWLLLQNWWDDMQLVEVDSEYFASCQATLTFVPQQKEDFAGVNLDSFYTMNRSLVADSSNLDRADYCGSDACFSMSHLHRDR